MTLKFATFGFNEKMFNFKNHKTLSMLKKSWNLPEKKEIFIVFERCKLQHRTLELFEQSRRLNSLTFRIKFDFNSLQASQEANLNVQSPVYSHAMPNAVSSNPDLMAQRKPVATSIGGLPAFVAMPQSSSQLTDRISNSPTLLEDSVNEVSKDDYAPVGFILLPFLPQEFTSIN